MQTYLHLADLSSDGLAVISEGEGETSFAAVAPDYEPANRDGEDEPSSSLFDRNPAAFDGLIRRIENESRLTILRQLFAMRSDDLVLLHQLGSGMTIAQIANKTRMSRQSVYKRLAEARRRSPLVDAVAKGVIG